MKLIQLLLLLFLSTQLFSQAVTVELVESDGNWTLLRGGDPYYIKGAGGSDFLDRLADYGGNSVRTWGTDENTLTLLDSAHSLGLTVCMGLWVGHQQHGFDYNNESAVTEQLEGFRKWVEEYKDHRAVLLWAIGNEVELGVSYSSLNLKVWDAINDISEMIHQVDGKHPTLTVTAGLSSTKLSDIMQRAPDLDMLGVNCYGCIGGVENTIDQGVWNKPYLITEWGPNGQWESPSTSWGATLELTSTQKAALYFDRYENEILPDTDKLVGSYVFLWGNKFEETPTWYGLFFDGYETEAVDVMTYHWSGVYPANRAPKITSVTLNGQAVNQNVVIKSEEDNRIILEVEDEDVNSLTFEYLIQPESGDEGAISDETHVLPYIPGLFTQTNATEGIFSTPDNLNEYRLFYFVRDNDGNIALGNFPFQVKLDPLVSDDPTIIFADRDAYIRDGAFEAEDHGVTDFERLLTRLSDNKDQGFIRETYVGFDLSSVNEAMETATVELYGGGTEGVKTVIYGIGDLPWRENTISWNTRYEDDELVPLDTIEISAELKYHQWNVRHYVFNRLASGDDFLSFVFRNITVDPKITTWASRETRPNPPRIVFDFNGGDLVLGIPPSSQRDLRIYPNPSSEVINIRTQHSIEKYEITSLEGKVIQSGLYMNDTIDIISLGTGIYILKLYGRDTLLQNRFYRK